VDLEGVEVLVGVCSRLCHFEWLECLEYSQDEFASSESPNDQLA